MEDIYGELVTVMLATSYAPVGNAKEHIRHAFTEDMEYLMEAQKYNEVLLVCIYATLEGKVM